MDQREFASHFDARTGTLELSGPFDHTHLLRIHEELDRAFRRTACYLTVDLSRAECVAAHTLGRVVHLCNAHYPGTFVRMPARSTPVLGVA